MDRRSAEKRSHGNRLFKAAEFEQASLVYQQAANMGQHVACCILCAAHRTNAARRPAGSRTRARNTCLGAQRSAAQRLAALRWMAWAATAAWRFVAAAREWDLCVCWLTAAQALEMLEALPTNIFKPTIAEQVGE